MKDEKEKLSKKEIANIILQSVLAAAALITAIKS